MRASLVFVAAMFVSGILLGYLAPLDIGSLTINLEDISSLRPLGFAFYVFTNNLTTTLLALLGGLIVILPPLIVFANGVVLGSFIHLALSKYTLLELLMFTLPHGMFEIPALLLASEGGTRLAMRIVERGYRGLTEELPEYLSGYTLVLLLLFIAMIMETLVAYYH